MNSIITSNSALKILDSRGNPTVRSYMAHEDGTKTFASGPSVASAGQNETLELRDDKKRYAKKNVQKTVPHVNEETGKALIGMDAIGQQNIDYNMIGLDGTHTKSRLGTNAILSISKAVAKAAADSSIEPLYRYLGGTIAVRIPVPCIKILNGSDRIAKFNRWLEIKHESGARSEYRGK